MQYESNANASQDPSESYTHILATQYDGEIYTEGVHDLEVKSGSVQTNAVSVGLINTPYVHELEVQISDL